MIHSFTWCLRHVAQHQHGDMFCPQVQTFVVTHGWIRMLLFHVNGRRSVNRIDQIINLIKEGCTCFPSHPYFLHFAGNPAVPRVPIAHLLKGGRLPGRGEEGDYREHHSVQKAPRGERSQDRLPRGPQGTYLLYTTATLCRSYIIFFQHTLCMG